MKFANQLENIEDALSIRYNQKVYSMQEKWEKIAVLSLWEAFFDIPLYNFKDLDKNKYYHYSSSLWIVWLRKKISDYYNNHYWVPIDYNNELIISTWSKAIIYMLFKSLLDPLDEVIVFEPAWVSYIQQIRMCNGKEITIPYNNTIYDLDNFITNKTRIIVINNPNNPTWKNYTLEELQYLYDIAKEKDITIISDEAYSDFVPDDDKFISMWFIDKEKTNSIIVNSISKNFWISWWRIWYAIWNKKIIDKLLILNQHIITCAPTILLMYIEKYFENIISITKPQIKALLDKRKDIQLFIINNWIEILDWNSTFYFFLNIWKSKLKSIDFCDKLLDELKICAVPWIWYWKSTDRFIRIWIWTEKVEVIKESILIIKKLINQTSL